MAAMVSSSAALQPAQGVGSKKRVLHLIGSRQDPFYFDLSVLYAKACVSCDQLDRERYEFLFAVVGLDGLWSFPESLDGKVMEATSRMPLAKALAHIQTIGVDCMVPHMFCVEGMTRFRSLFDLLQIPFLGNKEYSVWPATDKAITKQVLEACGVQVPRGELLIKGQHSRPSSVGVPMVVKPCNEDNSRGITLVKREEDLDQALEYAFSFDSRVIVDEYIAGREVRVGCVEEADGSLTILPKLEYFLMDIRTTAHKLASDEKGKLTQNAVKDAKRDGDRQCPADLSPALHARIDEQVRAAHKALRCRHYSLFDLRVDANEQPYILEACLFCSFSPVSVIPSMAEHSGREDLRHPNLFHGLIERVCAESASTTPLAPVERGSGSPSSSTTASERGSSDARSEEGR